MKSRFAFGAVLALAFIGGAAVAQFYLSGNTWFQPVYGANGVFYKVVPTP